MSNGTDNWKIVAQRGNSAYLIQTGPDMSIGDCTGRVLDLSQEMLFPDFNIHSILSRGYWDDFTGSQDELTGLLSQVHRADTPEDQMRIKQELEAEKALR